MDGATLPTLANTPIPRLVRWGIQAIERAGSFDDLRNVRNTIDALRGYMRAQGASLDAVNAATQLRIRADRRTGEVLAGMEKNEGVRLGGINVIPPGDEPTYGSLGITKLQASRWQQLAAVPIEIFEAAIALHEAQGAPVTTASVLRIAAMAAERDATPEDIAAVAAPNPAEASKREAAFWGALDRATSRSLPIEKNTGEYEWYTPPGVIDAARRVMGGIDLDPASNDIAQRTVQAARFYTRESDGLSQPWGGRVWLNPPYSADLIDKFVAKLAQHADAGEIEAAVLLVDNKTDTRWFHQAAGACSRICFTRGRIGFLRPDGSPGAPTNGSALFYFGANPRAFAREFGETGLVVRRHA